MAQESKKTEPEVDQEDEESEGETSASESSEESSGSGETMRAGDDEALVKADDQESDEGGEGGEGDEDHAAAQLGVDRYVLAGFFATGMMGAYVIGRAIQQAWMSAANKDWFAQHFQRLAAVSDDDKAMYGIIIGGIFSLAVVYRTYKNADIRAWADEVASELAKCVWPNRKEVTSSTFVVIVASAAATLYLALLDRLWAFVTNIVYGDGS